MRTPPLRRQLLTAALGVVAVVLVAVGGFVYLSLQAGLEDALDEVLRTRADAVAQLSEQLDPVELAEQLDALGIPAAVVTADGRELEAGRRSGTRAGAVLPAAGSPPPHISTVQDLQGGGHVEVFASRAGVDTTLRRLLVLLAGSSIAALLAAGIVLRWLTGRALLPLNQIVATAERTTAGASGERLRPQSPGTEIGRLAVSLDGMLDALESALEGSRNAELATRRFLAQVAHQLRTPLTGIGLSAGVLSAGTATDNHATLLHNIERETARASRLLTSLLHIERLEQGDALRLVPTDIVDLCRKEIERAAALAPNLDFSMCMDDTSPVTPVLVDADELTEALSNLLDNAGRHAHRQVIVQPRTAGPWTEIHVSDDGPGLPPGKEEAAFARFTKLDGQAGSGLGLPIARSIARTHGGDLVYEDGTFVLRVPMTRQPPSGALVGGHPSEAELPPSWRRRRGDRRAWSGVERRRSVPQHNGG